MNLTRYYFYEFYYSILRFKPNVHDMFSEKNRLLLYKEFRYIKNYILT